MPEDQGHDLPARVTHLERQHAILDKDVLYLKTIQTAQHQENIGRFADVEDISTKNSEKLDMLLGRATFADGNAAGKAAFWKGIAVVLGIIAAFAVLVPWIWPRVSGE